MKNTTSIHFADDIVFHYSKFEEVSGCYTISLNDIPEFDLGELTSILMNENPDMASEATGPDNPNYENKMLPAFTRYLKNTSDRDEEIEFNSAWKDGVQKYFLPKILELLSNSIDNFNQDQGYTTEHDYVSGRDNGSTYDIWRHQA